MKIEDENGYNEEKSTPEEKIFQQINQIRKDPASFIPLLKKEMTFFKGVIFTRPGSFSIKTNEGINAYKEAIEFLENQNPVPELEYNETLQKVATDLIEDIGNIGEISHNDKSGNNVSDRVEKYLEWEDRCCENIEIGGTRGYDTVIDLLVDDGNKSRSRRQNLFFEDLKYIGVGCGNHSEYNQINVIVCTGNLRDKGSLFYDYNNFKYEYTQNEHKNIVNEYQYDDPDAPDDAVGLSIKKEFKFYKDKKVGVVKKFYTLSDGKIHVIEKEEF